MKKNITKRFLAFTLPVILMTGMLSGCQSKQDGKEETLSSEDEKGGVVALTVWCATEDEELMNQMIGSFKTEYASEAEFDITMEAIGEADCKDELFADMEGGADVFTFADDQLRILVAAGALSPVMNADTVKSANIEGASETATINDKLYAYPMTADNGYFLYYNKAYFSEADVQSLNTMLDVAAASNKKVVMDWTSGWYLYSFFGGTGLEMGLNDDGVSNHCNWNATGTEIQGIDVATAMLSIANHPGFLNAVDASFVSGIQDGSVIAGVFGVWDSNAVAEAWGENYGATKLPTYSCAGKDVQMASFTGYKMVGVNAYSDNEEWAHKLAEWITNEENQTLRFTMRGQGPSNIKAAASPEVAEAPAIQAILAQSEYAVPQRIGANYWAPAQKFGEQMASGMTPSDLQQYMDSLVEEITLSYSN